MKTHEIGFSRSEKLRLGARVLGTFIRVRIGLWLHPLPELVDRLSSARPHDRRALPPPRLGRVVWKTLRLGQRRPRCLTSSLVLYRLLRSQGTEADVVIGLPERPEDKAAHAWVEVALTDVGPPPGRGSHVELARYPNRTEFPAIRP